MTQTKVTIAIRIALLAAVALWAAPGRADWRKNGMATGDYRKDAHSDFKDLRTKRPNEPPPTQSGKLDEGIKIKHERGSIVYRIDMYPNYVARIPLEKSYTDIFVPKPEIADILPVPNCKRPMMISNKVPPNDETTGQAVKNEEGCNAIIIQAKTPRNPNGEQTAGSNDGTPQAPFSPSGGGTVAGSGGSAVATASMTNILALDSEGQVVANLMINTMPSWQRPDEGKVEIHNRSYPATGVKGHSSGSLATYENFQCDPTCRRVRDPSEGSQTNSVEGVGAQGGEHTNISNSNAGGN
jgi:hypothetical protein